MIVRLALLFVICIAGGELIFMLSFSGKLAIAALVLSQALTGTIGILLLKKQDFHLLFYIENQQNQYLPVIQELWGEALHIFACLFLIIPGYFSDIIGVVLWLPIVQKRLLKLIP